MVDVRDVGRVEPWDVTPGGLPARPSATAGTRRPAARCAGPPRTARRAGPTGPPSKKATRFGLVVLAPRDDVAVHAPDPEPPNPVSSGTPHLYAGVVEGTGVVGPLVLPGETGCAGCLQQDRTDRDPVWPRLAAQWRSGRQRRSAPAT
ncbi:hypothetical protein GCM10023238_38900 [Streptomyces heliomycini]